MVSEARTTSVADAVCLACGCLCDDIALTVEAGGIVEARNACAIGRAAFLAEPPAGPAAVLDGRDAALDAALARAAAILRESRCPLVTGLSGSTLEAQAAAVALAIDLGATIDPAHSAHAEPALAAFQRVGRIGATLGEVRNRADVVVFWGVDPVTTHPRHFERYSVEPPGRFVTGPRTVLVADAAPTATSARANGFLRFEPGRQFETLRRLRAMVRGLALDESDDLRPWFTALAAARYGAFFHGPDLNREGAASVQEAFELVRDLNAPEGRRFVTLPLGGPGNRPGIEAALTWAAGAPMAVDAAHGSPRFRPREATAEARLARGEADAVLIVGDEPGPLSPAARAHLGRIPLIVIAPDATDPARAASVGLAAARTGIEAAGSVMRVDGVTLPLRPAATSPRPTELDLLRRLRAAIGADPVGTDAP